VLNDAVEYCRNFFKELGDRNIFQLGEKRQGINEHSESIRKFDVGATAGNCRQVNFAVGGISCDNVTQHGKAQRGRRQLVGAAKSFDVA